MEIPKYKNWVFNFFYSFIQKRQLSLWDKMPRSQMRLYMFLLQNGNSMTRHDLVDKLVDIGYAKNRNAAKAAYHRGLNNNILIENNGVLSVTEPIEFVIKFGSIYDSWRFLLVPTSILSIIYILINPSIAIVLGLLTFALIMVVFISDFFNTVKY